MLLIRPVDINEDTLIESNIPETTINPWFDDVTYDAGDAVAFRDTPVALVNAANTTVTDLGGGVYSIQKTGGADGAFDASFRASTGFGGDFAIRIEVVTPSASWEAIGVSPDPTTGNTMAAIYFAFVRQNASNWMVYANGNQLVPSTGTGAYSFIWRQGSTLFFGHGATLQEAAAAPVYVSYNVTGPLFVDSSLGGAGTVVEVSAVGLNARPGAPVATYSSLGAANVGNPPHSSPGQWGYGRALPALWSESIAYAAGDIVLGSAYRQLSESQFDTDLDGWTAATAGAGGTGSVAWIAGGAIRISVTANTDAADISKDFATVPGRRYRVTVSVVAYSGGSGWYVQLVNGDSLFFNQTAIGTFDAEFTATQTTSTIRMSTSGWTGTLTITDFDSFTIDEVYSDGREYESLLGAARSVPITIASPGVVTWLDHGAAADTPVVFSTSGKLPTGIVAGTVYYVRDPAQHTFKVAATPGGADINTSGSQSGAHTAVLDPNRGNDPILDDGSNWLFAAPSNRWAMFDNGAGTMTSDPARIDVTIEPGERVDALALLNIENAADVQVIMTAAPDGVVYDETFDMTSSGPIFDWYSYFGEAIELSRALLVADLPSYSNPSIQVIISGGDISVGVFVLGRSFDLGRTLHNGAQVGITDYSRKEADDFGNYAIVERAFAKRGSFQNLITAGQVDGVQETLADYRATPAVYSASPDYDATLIFGFFRDFQIEIAYPNESLVSIEIEGLI